MLFMTVECRGRFAASCAGAENTLWMYELGMTPSPAAPQRVRTAGRSSLVCPPSL